MGVGVDVLSGVKPEVLWFRAGFYADDRASVGGREHEPRMLTVMSGRVGGFSTIYLDAKGPKMKIIGPFVFHHGIGHIWINR